MHITAHISDLHIDDDRSIDRARRVMDYLNAFVEPIDVLLVTGDLADHGEPSQYRTVRELLKSRWPVLHLPGNHDVRAAYRQSMYDEPAADSAINRHRTIDGVNYLLCDSTIPGQNSGLLDAESLAWLDENLRRDTQTPSYVCFHHPPATLGYFVDSIRQRGEAELERLLAEHPQVVALLCGHTHTPAVTSFAGLPLLAAPGVINTSFLPWESTERLNHAAPPMVAFHLLGDDRRVTTHFRVVA